MKNNCIKIVNLRINKKAGISDKDLFYSGPVEYIENILVNAYNTKEKNQAIDNEKHPLVFMFDACLFEYINYFPIDTIFITLPRCIIYKNNYSDYTIYTLTEGIEYLTNPIIMGSYYYAKIGKDIDDDIKIFFYIVLGMTLLTSIFLSFIMKRVLKNMDETNILLINFLNLSHIRFIINSKCWKLFIFFLFYGKRFF